MNRTEIEDRARRLVVEHCGISSDKITADASFIDDLGLDSLDCVELSMACEEEFRITMSDEDAERVINSGTFDELVAYLDAAN